MRGSSMTDIGDYNEKLVLQLIRGAADGISQSGVGRRCHLSRQAVSLIVRRLIAQGLVETDGQRITGPGKPQTVLRVVPDARLAVGVHLDPAHITVAITDLAARPLALSSLEAPTSEPRRDIERIAAAIGALGASIGATTPGSRELGDDPDPAPARRSLLGIGIAAPGRLDAAHGIVRDPPWIPWRGVPVVAALREASGLPAMLDKDTNAALTGEIWTRNLPSSETVLYLYVSHGVGSAVSAHGTVHRGGSTQAGEIGHLPTGLIDLLCECGNHGCLSLYTDAHLLVESARLAGAQLRAASGVKGRIGAVRRAAGTGNRGARDAILRHGGALGRAMRTLVGIHDPQRIIIGGPLWPDLQQWAMPPVREQLQEWLDEKGARLETSHLGDDVGALGAASLFLQQELSPGRGFVGSGRTGDRMSLPPQL